MQQVSETQTERLSTGLDRVAESLCSDAESAATGASEILDTFPGQPQALLLLVSALKLMGAETGSRSLIEWMAEEYPNLASIQYELGLLLGRLGMSKEAVERLSRTVALEPNHPAAWRALGNQLALSGDKQGSSKAYLRHLQLSLRELKLLEDATAGAADELAKAENMLNQALTINPTDVVTLRMLGELHLQFGRLREAEATLKRALELAPDCMATRKDYCMALTQSMDWKGANAQVHILLKQDQDDPALEALLATSLIMLGEHNKAMQLFQELRLKASGNKDFWLNYGHAARSVGQDKETIVEAYRKCLELDPGYGTGWWALADLKTYRFSSSEIATMRDQLRQHDLSDGQRCHFEFALGKALEDEGAYAESFEHYRQANALRRPYAPHNADSMHADIVRTKKLFTPEFLAARKNMGCPSPDPIFIVGMPRAGSTLIEQILASHSLVEGTMELSDLGEMVRELKLQHPGEHFPDLLENPDMNSVALRKLGEEYLARTRHQRTEGRPFFTDKAGSNFTFVALIQIILPNAKIVDARRHPLACGFSCYKQAFAPGALHLAYDQTDIGRYYHDYVEAMAHYDRVLPGRVHRIFHEDLVQNPEPEIRRLLAYCDLPFEEQCLRFHETDRSVRTSSSQQVRQPIRRKAVEDWQQYQEWLQPMKDALGDVLTRYPLVPRFD